MAEKSAEIRSGAHITGSQEIAVVGSERFALGFRLVGIRHVAEASTPRDLEKAVSEAMNDPKVGLLVMETGDVGKLSPITRERLAKSVRPTLVTIGVEEDSALREQIKQAVGVDLWKGT
jgi:V/A-type H+-transporting ATPase subunit F